METNPHYTRPPITEALIDIRTTAPEGADLHTLSALHDAVREAYPRKNPRVLVTSQLTVGSQVGASASQSTIGYAFSTDDGKLVFQARLDGFTLSRLSPYTHWEEFRDEARRLWDVYRSAVCPCALTRLAVRYINRIELPLPLRDFGDYLRTVPVVSPDLPQALAEYLVRLNIPLPDLRAVLLLNVALMPALTEEDVVPIALDIDIFRHEDVPQDEAGVWGYMDCLRERKNQVFEACITDEARRLFDG